MPRQRKPLESQTGNLTVEFQQQRAFEESLVKVDNSMLSEAPTDELVSDYAVKVWEQSVKELKKINAFGNLDFRNLVGFCNAVALYQKATIALKNKKLTIRKGGEEIARPEIKIQKIYADEIRRFGALCGMTYDSRIKIASTKAREIDDNISAEFGDI